MQEWTRVSDYSLNDNLANLTDTLNLFLLLLYNGVFILFYFRFVSVYFVLSLYLVYFGYILWI